MTFCPTLCSPFVFASAFGYFLISPAAASSSVMASLDATQKGFCNEDSDNGNNNVIVLNNIVEALAGVQNQMLLFCLYNQTKRRRTLTNFCQSGHISCFGGCVRIRPPSLQRCVFSYSLVVIGGTCCCSLSNPSLFLQFSCHGIINPWLHSPDAKNSARSNEGLSKSLGRGAKANTCTKKSLRPARAFWAIFVSKTH